MARISYIGTKEHKDLLKSYLPDEDQLVDFCIKPNSCTNGESCADILFISIHQKENDGIDLMYQLEEKIRKEELMVIFMAEELEEFLQVEIYKAGANDILTLPLGKRLFQYKLESWKQNVNCCQSILQECGKGELVFSKEKYAVKSGNGEITLSKREFEILSLLDSIPDKIFTRDEIKQEVWGDSNIHERTVDVYIKKLRDLLGESRIKTMSGVGYKLSR